MKISKTDRIFNTTKKNYISENTTIDRKTINELIKIDRLIDFIDDNDKTFLIFHLVIDFRINRIDFFLVEIIMLYEEFLCFHCRFDLTVNKNDDNRQTRKKNISTKHKRIKFSIFFR
ncbi:hypothetical protein DERF_014919 [Dermatophagoides farinae]|uniref:Uncharacterized protein n=1 Tax=Dermatophagoides farinae TaxID=6954 RepID=A0A922KVB9_DERFA|nr:hypothetical protein DERF_014919 [Dermatophagoides farinae]